MGVTELDHAFLVTHIANARVFIGSEQGARLLVGHGGDVVHVLATRHTEPPNAVSTRKVGPAAVAGVEEWKVAHVPNASSRGALRVRARVPR